MIDIEKYPILVENYLSLKEISKDDSDKSNVIYMTNSEIEAVAFDKVKTIYTNKLGLSEECAASFDAFAFLKNLEIFIEFKNGNMKNEKRKVKDKVRDSLLIFCDIIDCNISYIRENIDFILVYNEEKNKMSEQEKRQIGKKQSSEKPSIVKIGEHFAQKAKEDYIRFDLERFKTLYFRKVYTFTENEFDEYLDKLFKSMK